MTDKDPKDMTAAELLREADSNPCSMCHLVMTGDESCATTGCTSWAYRLADKIDAELAKARELSLLRGAELWAKANGWPDFKEGEGFGAWLRRCALKRPVFDDGEPMQIGNLVSSKLFGNVSVGAIEYTATDVFVKDAPDGDWSTSILVDKPLKRPAPEVMGADGLPIKVGETVWSLSGAGPLTVISLHTDDPAPDGGDTPWADLDDGGLYSSWIYAGSLTHTPPDTQERIDEDAEKFHCVYFGGYSACGTCPASTGELSKKSCKQQQIFDLLHRQRELDKRKGGAE